MRSLSRRSIGFTGFHEMNDLIVPTSPASREDGNDCKTARNKPDPDAEPTGQAGRPEHAEPKANPPVADRGKDHPHIAQPSAESDRAATMPD